MSTTPAPRKRTRRTAYGIAMLDTPDGSTYAVRHRIDNARWLAHSIAREHLRSRATLDRPRAVHALTQIRGYRGGTMTVDLGLGATLTITKTTLPGAKS